jgi:predicted type IV restriction endonuclease
MLERDENEGNTRLLVTDFLCDGLGFDKYTDLTTEYQVKGEFADYGIRIDKELVAFIECKRVATKLAAKHLRQAQTYALNEGVEWVLLTNGAQWQAYHCKDACRSRSCSRSGLAR